MNNALGINIDLNTLIQAVLLFTLLGSIRWIRDTFKELQHGQSELSKDLIKLSEWREHHVDTHRLLPPNCPGRVSD